MFQISFMPEAGSNLKCMSTKCITYIFPPSPLSLLLGDPDSLAAEAWFCGDPSESVHSVISKQVVTYPSLFSVIKY